MLTASLSGAIYGLSLARFLFELNPLQFALLGAWPGALLVSALGLVLAAGLSLRTCRLDPATFPYAPWAPIAMALPLFSLLAPDVNLLRGLTLLTGGLALLPLFFFQPMRRLDLPIRSNDRLPPHTFFQRLMPVGLFIGLFLLYLRTLAPAVGSADTFEFQVGVARLGIAHGSGYPLLMLVGRLFTLLPVGGTLAYRANLSSAFFAALAAVGVERLSRRLGAGPVVAALVGLTFGVSPTLWSRAVEIEVFALNAAFVAAILYLCLHLILSPPRPFSSAPSPITDLQRRLMLLAFLFGLSLTNHLTTLFLGPGCLLAGFIALWRQVHSAQPNSPVTPNLLDPVPVTRRPPLTAHEGIPATRHPSLASILRPASFVLVSLLLGLSIYLYIPIRWPAVNHGQALSPAGFVNILTGNEAKGVFNWRLPFQDPGRYPIVWSKIAGAYGWPGLALSLLGIISLLRPLSFTAPAITSRPARKRHRISSSNGQLPITNYLLLATLLITSIGYIYFALAFNVPDPSFSSYLLPLHLITAVLMALGLQWLLDLTARLFHSSVGHRPAVANAPACLLLTAFCLLPLGSLWRNFPLLDRSGKWSAQQLGDLMLNQPLAKGATILADSEKIAPLDYLQIAEGRRPDLDIIVLPDEASYRAALDERLAAGQVVYLGRYLPGLGSAYSLRSIGPLAEVSPAAFTTSPVAALPPLAQPAGVGLNLIGYAALNGEAVLSTASQGELDLTLVWQAQSVPVDNLLVNLRLVDSSGRAASQSNGSVPVGGLYPTNAWRAGEVISDFYRQPIGPSLAPGTYQLQVALLPPFAPSVESAWRPVAPVTILPPAQSPTPPRLLRAQFGASWLLGYDLPEAVAPNSRFAVTLYWLHTAETGVVTAFNETRSLAAWPIGAVVPMVYNLTAPANGDHMDLAVETGLPARCGWLAPQTTTCGLPAVHLVGQAAAEGAVNFDNHILLNHATLETLSSAPGGSVNIQLEWQALRAISENYSIFVHLLGPDGLIHGQIDRWPVSGTRATSGWAPGERIADAYSLQLPADAPLGAYTVEVGLYLLGTGQRLPVLNLDGLPVDDRLLLHGLLVGP